MSQRAAGPFDVKVTPQKPDTQIARAHMQIHAHALARIGLQGLRRILQRTAALVVDHATAQADQRRKQQILSFHAILATTYVNCATVVP